MDKIEIFTDGSSKGNPGKSACGIVIYYNKKEIKKYRQTLGIMTNNQAEYWGVILALEKIRLIFGKKKIKNMEIKINIDSELLFYQLTGTYKILNPEIQKLFLKIWNLKIDFSKVEFKLIPREQNKIADRLAN